MTSRRVEDKHKTAVEQILSHSGLVCNRSPSVYTQASLETMKSEEAVITEEETESSLDLTSLEESSKDIPLEAAEEEKPFFPSPSLRKMLPDNIRHIEEQNRIHVLPKEFRTKIDPELIPKITPQFKYIDIIASLVGCTEYRSSLAEFWFLDTLANLLRRAQEDELPRPTQAVLMLWFCEWMKEIQHFDAADRKRMLRRFKDNMLSAARFIVDSPRLPTPDEAGVYYRAIDEDEAPADDIKPNGLTKQIPAAIPRTTPEPPDDTHVVAFADCAYECAMRDLVAIMHYIFDLFSTDYQFDLVRSIFTFTPEYSLIDMPHPLRTPKRMFVPLKPKKEKPPKKEKEKKEGKGKKKEPDTAEYIALMELKAQDEREFEEKEHQEAESWNKKNSILPLAFAGTDELFDKYWPPPPPEPEPEPEPKPEKGKKKK